VNKFFVDNYKDI